MSNRTVTLNGSMTTSRYDIYNQSTTVFNDSGVADVWNELRPDRVRTRRPTGWLEPTGYSMETATDRSCVGTYRHEIPSAYRWTVSGTLLGSRVPGELNYLLPTGGMKQAAEIKALLALKDQHINLGVAFAEAQQTANLIGSTAKRLAKGYTHFKNGQFRKGMDALGGSYKKVPNHWLEAQYAWKPLLSDVYGASEALASNPRTNWVMTGKGNVRVIEESQDDYLFGGAIARCVAERMSGCYVRLDYLPGNTFLDSLSRVGMTNPLEVIWEKVPFSFVVDWFLPIGDWLSAMDATIGWEFRAGSCSILRRTKCKVTAAPPLGRYLGGRFNGSFKRVKLDRTVYSSSPLPYPPRPKNPLSLGHMANGLSLLASAFGKR